MNHMQNFLLKRRKPCEGTAYFVLFISGFPVLNIVLDLVINVRKCFLSER